MANAVSVQVEQDDIQARLVVDIDESNDLTADAVAFELKALAAAAMLGLGYHRDLVDRYLYQDFA